MTPLAPRSPLFPYTTLFRSRWAGSYSAACTMQVQPAAIWAVVGGQTAAGLVAAPPPSGVSVALAGISRFTLPGRFRSEEHTSELQSHSDLVCRLLLEKKKKR